MMEEQYPTTVRTSTGFRDAVFDLDRRNLAVYVRPAEQQGPIFRVRMMRAFDRATIYEIFGSEKFLPVEMEVVATAMSRAEKAGKEVPELVVFTYGDLGDS